MSNVTEIKLITSLKAFNKELDTKEVITGDEIDIFRQIKKDLVELDTAMFGEIHGILFDISIEDYNSNTIYNLEHIGIEDTYREGFSKNLLGMYNVFINMYEYKCYNLNEYDNLLEAFNEYEKTLNRVFSRYINIDIIDAITRFNELLNSRLI